MLRLVFYLPSMLSSGDRRREAHRVFIWRARVEQMKGDRRPTGALSTAGAVSAHSQHTSHLVCLAWRHNKIFCNILLSWWDN